jgi:hypothetical protein
MFLMMFLNNLKEIDSMDIKRILEKNKNTIINIINNCTY